MTVSINTPVLSQRQSSCLVRLAKMCVTMMAAANRMVVSTMHTAKPVLNGQFKWLTKSNSNHPNTVGTPGMMPYSTTASTTHEMRKATTVPQMVAR